MTTTVIVLSSHVAAGAVGGRVSAFVLESLGIRTVVVPTVTLAWHPGLGRATRVVPDRFDALADDLAAAPWLDRVGGILSGYLGGAAQAGAIARLVEAAKRANPRCRYLCDPVIGDTGGLYVPEATAAAVRDDLLPLADMATPNAAEFGWLARGTTGPLDPASIPAMAATLAVGELIVTSAPAGPGRSGALLATDSGMTRADHPAIAGEIKGLGDLFAARYLAARLAGHAPAAAMRTATATALVFAGKAAERADRELPIAGAGALLSPPDNLVEVRPPV